MGNIIDSILTGGVGVAIIGLLSQIIGKVLDMKQTQDKSVNRQVNPHAFENDINLQSVIDRVVNKTNVERFLVLKVENGGGKPRVGANLYSSVLFESVTGMFKSVKADYHRILVDQMYVKMLSDIGLSQHNALRVNKMKSGILKRLYESEGVQYSEIHYIGETETSFYFCSVSTSDDKCDFSDINDRVEIEIAINRIRSIFNSGE